MLSKENNCLKEGQPCRAGLEHFNEQLYTLRERNVNPFQYTSSRRYYICCTGMLAYILQWRGRDLYFVLIAWCFLMVKSFLGFSYRMFCLFISSSFAFKAAIERSSKTLICNGRPPPKSAPSWGLTWKWAPWVLFRDNTVVVNPGLFWHSFLAGGA